MPKPANNPRLPSVTSDIPRDLRMFLDRVREVLLTGDQVREIIRSTPPGSGGPGDPGGPPGPNGPIDAPTAPTGLSATGAAQSIIVQWDAAPYRGHRHTEVWACERDDLGQAESVGMAPGAQFSHVVGPLVGRWYWVRFVNENGVVGPFNAQNGTYGESQEVILPEPPIIDLDDSELTRRLNEVVGWIEDPTFGLRAEATRIRGQFDALVNDTIDDIYDTIAEVQNELNTILVTAEFDEDATYVVGDLVLWDDPATSSTNSGIYKCIQAIPTPPAPLPSDEDYWELVGDSATVQALYDDLAAAQLLLQARGLTAPDGQVIESMAAALLNIQAVLETTDETLASANALLALTGRVTNTEGTLEVLATAMLAAGVIVEDGDSYIASDAFLTLFSLIEQLSSNLLGNSEFMQADKEDPGDAWANEPPDQWTIERLSGAAATVGTNFSVRSSPASGDGTRALFLNSATALGSGQSIVIRQSAIPVVPEWRYQVSIYVGSPLSAVRARIRVTFDDPEDTVFESNETVLTETGLGPDTDTGASLEDYDRIHAFGEAPEDATTATIALIVTPNNANPAVLYATRPFFGTASDGQSLPSPWSPGVPFNAFTAISRAILNAGTEYRDPVSGIVATSEAFNSLNTLVRFGADGIEAISTAALGAAAAITSADGSQRLAANSLFNLHSEVYDNETGLGALSTALQGVSATIANSSGNLLADVSLKTIDAADEADRKWLRLVSIDWTSAAFGKDDPAYTVASVPESVGFIKKAGARPISGLAQIYQDVPVVAGQWYQFNAWLLAVSCRARLYIGFEVGGTFGYWQSVSLDPTGGNGRTQAGYVRKHLAAVAVAGATKARVIIRADSATTTNPAIYAFRPLFAEAVPNQAVPSAWLPPVADAFAFQEMSVKVEQTAELASSAASLAEGVNATVEGVGGLAESYNTLSASVERVFENRLRYSEAFNAWTVTGLFITVDTALVPGFTGTEALPTPRADALRETASNGQHHVSQGGIPVEGGYSHTASVYVKPVGGRHCVIRIALFKGAVFSTQSYFSYNIVTGSFPGISGNLPGTSGGATAVGDGWFRCRASFVAAKDDTLAEITIYTSGSAVLYTAPPSFVGSPSAGLDLFGAQVNAGLSPDSYRKTTTSPLFGPIHDRAIATAAAVTAINSQLEDPETGELISASAFSQLVTHAKPGGALAQRVDGLQAGLGRGGNLLPNSAFDGRGMHWTFTITGLDAPNDQQYKQYYQLSDAAASRPNWSLEGDPKPVTGAILYTTTTRTYGYGEYVSSFFDVSPDKWFELSTYIQAHRCQGSIGVYWYTADGAPIVGNMSPFMTESAAGESGGIPLSRWPRLFALFKSPANAAKARFFIRSTPLATTQGDSALFFVKPFVAVGVEGQTVPSSYSVGPDPDVYASLREEGVVWADPSGEGTAGAMYTIRLRAQDNTGAAQVGFGMSALKENGRWVADVRFNANRFAIQDPAQPDNAGSKKYPFIIDGGTVFMNTAVIKDASIGSAKIADLAVNTAKIADLAVNNAKIANATIQGGKIANATLTNVNIVSGTINGINIADLTIGTRNLGSAAAMFMQPFKVSNTNASGAQFNFYAGTGVNEVVKVFEVAGVVRMDGGSGFVANGEYRVRVIITISNAISVVDIEHIFKADAGGVLKKEYVTIYGNVSSAQLGSYNFGPQYVLAKTTLAQPSGKAPTFELNGCATAQKN